MDPLRYPGAGRGRGRGSWAPMPFNTQEVQMLRRPHHVANSPPASASVEAQPTEQKKSDKSTEDIIKNSTLSVYAAEFVPKCYPPVQQGSAHVSKHSVQSRIQMARETPNHVPIIQPQHSTHSYEQQQHYHQADQHQQYKNYSHQHRANQHVNAQDYGHYDGGAGDYKDRYQESSGEEDNDILDFPSTRQQLLNIIHSLILNPGRFSSLVPSLLGRLRPYLEFSSHFREIIGIIIQQSINEGNFRYSGARLCTCMDNTIMPNQQATFREILYSLCKEETTTISFAWQQRNEHTEEEQKRCHGLILFLAELVTQMEDTPAFGLGELLVELITVVLKKPAPNSVKHICQALKLAGQSLERDKGGCRKEMENMMRALTELVTEGRVDSHVGRMVDSVQELRNGNWGQTTPSTDSSSIGNTEGSDELQATDEPVFYGPDGKVLSPEENEFLKDVADSQSDESGGKWLSEEDNEMNKAYEEFLRLMPNKPSKDTKK